MKIKLGFGRVAGAVVGAAVSYLYFLYNEDEYALCNIATNCTSTATPDLVRCNQQCPKPLTDRISAYGTISLGAAAGGALGYLLETHRYKPNKRRRQKR